MEVEHTSRRGDGETNADPMVKRRMDATSLFRLAGDMSHLASIVRGETQRRHAEWEKDGRTSERNGRRTEKRRKKHPDQDVLTTRNERRIPAETNAISWCCSSKYKPPNRAQVYPSKRKNSTPSCS
eukprot:scaffold748_cov329-Pavlova_lutheri.AAC.11